MFRSHGGGLPHAQTTRGYTIHRRVKKDHTGEKRSHRGVVLLGQAHPQNTPIQACGWQHGPSWNAWKTFLYSVPSGHCKLAAMHGVLAWEVSQLGSLPPAAERGSAPPPPPYDCYKQNQSGLYVGRTSHACFH